MNETSLLKKLVFLLNQYAVTVKLIVYFTSLNKYIIHRLLLHKYILKVILKSPGKIV